MSALTPIEVCNHQLETHFPMDAFDTIGGIVMHNFGRMPQRNETVEINNHLIKVISCDHRKIKQVIITVAEVEKEDDQES